MAHSHQCMTGHYCRRMHSYWRRHWWWSCCYYYYHYYYYPGLAQREEQGEQRARPAAQQASPSVAMGPENCQRLATPLFSPLRCTRHSHGTHRGALVPCGVAWRRCNAIFGNQAPCGELASWCQGSWLLGLPRCLAVADGTRDCNCCNFSCRAHFCCTCHLCCHTTSKMRLYPHPLGRPTYGLAKNAQQYATTFQRA